MTRIDPNLPVPAKNARSRVRLSTLDDISKELKRLHLQVEAGQISGIEAVRRARVLSQLAQVFTASDVEKRLARIEKSLNKR